MATQENFPIIKLTENDVPGAAFTYRSIEAHSNTQLRRWLECRGLKTTGNRPDLLQRVENCIASGDDSNIIISVDKGHWHAEKLASMNKNGKKSPQEDVPSTSTAAPSNWLSFPSKQIPKNFNQGHIHHYIIESVQHMQLPEDDSGDEFDCLDLHTAKPLRKGRCFFTSHHISELYDAEDENCYHVKSRVKASYKTKSYDTTIALSKASGFVIRASCTCRASSMARCNHICGLLFAILDFTEKCGYDPTEKSCTEKACEWNKGRRTGKDPKRVSDAHYDSYKKKKTDNLISSFDPRPPSLQRDELTDREVHDFVRSLQNATEPNKLESMWLKVLEIKYDDYELDEKEMDILKQKCAMLVKNLSVGEASSPSPVEIVKDQKVDEWQAERRLRLTASTCKQVLCLKEESSQAAFITSKLWSTSKISVGPMEYGKSHEDMAREDYVKCHQRVSDFSVETTGLWVDPRHPELACSPDGLVRDPREKDLCGLLEIKCPFVLKDKDVHHFERELTKKQLYGFCLERVNQKVQLKRNHQYFYQIQMQLGVTGRKWCDFVVWSSEDLFIERIYADNVMWQHIVQRLIKFHHNHLCPEFFEMRLPRKLSPLLKLTEPTILF